MKRALLSSLVLAAVLLFGVTFAAAESDNAALIIRVAGGCTWDFGDLEAEGSVFYVEAKNGKWTLSCHGEIVEGLPIDRAVAVQSTADDPINKCFTPFGATEDWQATFTPSGRSHTICKGDLTP
jgi:hypothetical protein